MHVELRGILGQYNTTVSPPDGSGPLQVRLTIGVIDDRPAVVGVEIWGVDPSVVDRQLGARGRRRIKQTAIAPITATGVRLPLRKLLEKWIALQQQRARSVPELRFAAEVLQPGQPEAAATFAKLADRIDAIAARLPRRRRGHPPTLDLAHFKTVADLYDAALRSGSSHPRKDVAKAMHANESTAAKWIARCRTPEVGLLPPTSPGRSRGGEGVNDAPYKV